MGSTESTHGGDPGNLWEIVNRQMSDFDEFTVNIAGGDPLKREALDRGTVVAYWDAAVDYVTKLQMAKERAERASRKQGLPSRHG
jgi:hypothetical protein